MDDKQKTVHCWKDRLEWAEEHFGIGSRGWAIALDAPSATCMLHDGHIGPHEWVEDNQITVKFEPVL